MQVARNAVAVEEYNENEEVSFPIFSNKSKILIIKPLHRWQWQYAITE